MKRELNTKESVRTVTSNQFITACGLEGITYFSMDMMCHLNWTGKR